MSSDLAEFVLELGLRAKELSEEEQEKMSDLGKALIHAAKVGYDVRNCSEDANESATGKSEDNITVEKADEYYKHKVEEIKGP